VDAESAVTAPCIQYGDGYRFQLRRTISIQTDVIPYASVDLEYLSLSMTGKFTVKEGYAWDGASKTLNPISGIRGSLFHDGLYQLMRLDLVDRDQYRIVADQLLHDCCMEDGMLPIRADAWYEAVRVLAYNASTPKQEPPILFAPEGCDSAVSQNALSGIVG